MSNLLSSQNVFILAGVGILAVLIVILAIWLVVISVRASKERAKAEIMEQRLAHVEDYLSHMSKRDMIPINSGEDEPISSANLTQAKAAKPASRVSPSKQSAAARTNESRETKSRRLKRQPVIPYGEAKPSTNEVHSAAKTVPSAPVSLSESEANPPVRSAPVAPQGRQSIKHDTRRRREERRQDQVRRRAESIVQEHTRSLEADRSRSSGNAHRR
ncbi:hypothetical protein [Adlercreutzia sp. ZJ304]|uniref:hypothetical protein n=1 Tax=Adlercreutzia sp. ZJ304 TaxID=2709791 RepID=UPI0013EBE31C|nr:hypothetical protein [Adlercreutzia sp. ZJ304]